MDNGIATSPFKERSGVTRMSGGVILTSELGRVRVRLRCVLSPRDMLVQASWSCMT